MLNEALEEKSLSIYDQVPEEILFAILAECDPETLIRFMQTSERSCRLASDQRLWKKQYQKYLPHMHLRSDFEPQSWYTKFTADYVGQYANKDQRQILKALIESDSEALKSIKKSLTTRGLSSHCFGGHYQVDLLRIVKKKKNQQVMDALFDILKEEYTLYSDTHVNAFQFSLFRLAMFLEQPISFLKKLMEENDYTAIHQDKRAEVNNAYSTALLDIVEEDHFELLKTLPLKPGNALVNYQTPHGGTALLLAIGKGNLAIVDQLIIFGANLNLRYTHDSFDESPCFAGVTYRNRYTVLHVAVLSKQRSIVDVLLKAGAPLDLQDFKGRTALHMAVLSKQIDIVDALINAGALLNLQDRRGKTPFIYAACVGNLEIGRLLFLKGANVNLNADLTLTNAIEEGHTSFALWAIRNLMIDASLKNNRRRLLLDTALSKGEKEVFIALLENGVDVNEQDERSETPIFKVLSAMFDKCPEEQLSMLPMLDCLLQHGVRFHSSKGGQEALFRKAFYTRNMDVLERLVKADAAIRPHDLKYLLTEGMNDRNLEIHKALLDFLIEKQLDINAQDENGNTLLHLAVMGREVSEEFLTTCLGAGASTEVVNKQGFTPLLLAIRRNNLPHVRLLHKKGARFDNLEAAYTPLQVAVERASNFSLDIIEYLLSHKAHVFEKNCLWKKSLLPSIRPLQDTLLHSFIRNNVDLVSYERFLDPLFIEEAGIFVDTLNGDQQTALMLAVRNRNISQVDYLLKKGANASIHTEQGLGIFLEAAHRVSYDIYSSSLVWERLQEVNPEFGKQFNENEKF